MNLLPTFLKTSALEAGHPHPRGQSLHFLCPLPCERCWELQVLTEGEPVPLNFPLEKHSEESAGVSYLLFELLS